MVKPLKGKKIFSQVYKSGRRFYEKDASAIISFREHLKVSENNESCDDNITFFAVIIGKRTEKKAVVRNRVKRLLRESVRKNFKGCEDYNKIFKYIIITWKKSPGLPGLIRLKDVEPVVRALLLKAYNSKF